MMKDIPNEGTPGEFCPKAALLFAFVDNPDAIGKADRDRVEEHLAHCSLCAEEISMLREKMEMELSLAPAVEELESIAVGLRSPQERPSFLDRLRDLAARYPRPAARLFDPAKVKDWLEGIGRIGPGLAELFDLSSLGMPELSQAAVRSGTRVSRADVDRLTGMVRKAGSAMTSGDYEEAGRIYGKLCEVFEGRPAQRQVRFLAGIAFFRSGAEKLALEYLRGSISEEASTEYYWVLANVLLRTGDLEGAFRCLQIVEGMEGPLAREAEKMLDRMVI